jgi:hypothetical protein
MLRAVVTTLPTLISVTKGATDLWDKFGPTIRGYFGL